MEKHFGKVNEYRASEGKTVEVPYRGPAQGVVLDICGGLRSACTYVGASCLKDLSKRTTFIRVTQQVNSMFDAARSETRLPESYLKPGVPVAGAAVTGTSSSSAAASGNGAAAEEPSTKRQRA